MRASESVYNFGIEQRDGPTNCKTTFLSLNANKYLQSIKKSSHKLLQMALDHVSYCVPRPDGIYNPFSELWVHLGHAQKPPNAGRRGMISVICSNEIPKLLYTRRSRGCSSNSVQISTPLSRLRLRLVTVKWRQTCSSDHVLSVSEAQGYHLDLKCRTNCLHSASD